MHNSLIDDIKSEIKLANRARTAGRLIFLIGLACIITSVLNKELLLAFSASGLLGCISGLVFIWLAKRHFSKMNDALNQERWKEDIKNRARREID